MMARTDDDRRDPRELSQARRLVLAALTGIGALFFLGVGVGSLAVSLQVEDPKPGAIPVGLVSLVFGAISAVALFRLRPWAAGEDGPVSPRIKRARRTFAASIWVGLALGFMLSLGTLGGGDSLGALGNGPVEPWVAIVALVVWLGVVPLMSWRWWRNIDEHEAHAYRQGAVAGMYAYAFLMPSWWMAWRGGFLPEPQPMLIFLAVMLVWAAVWLSRRAA